ncbi:MAG: hypothetical protein CME70_19400 [Halobacteriovorax sp.]|nr:hypothetical protein [Halobacteriovorax sp.]MBK26173.1 hypothetical protein [Halobacteriovorax sp.]|tara:strand:- start:100 stop:456 length:357 start_codon:yes stop_codon:yes gene_type:complete
MKNTFKDLTIRFIDDRSLKLAICIIFLFNIFDAFLTLAWVETGLAHETNPIMAYVLEIGPNVFLTIKISIVTLGLIILWFTKQYAWVRPITLGLLALYSYIVGIHLHFIQYLKLLHIV